MIKYNKISIRILSVNKIKELREWFSDKIISETNCDISIGITPNDCTIDKNATIFYCKADTWYISHLDTKIIAKICIIRMSLN